MTAESPRYAIYFAPAPETALWRFGSAVIGYDAASGMDMPFLTTAGMSPAQWLALTDEPRRYGFHATLKAPFHLAPGRDEAQLLARVATVAASASAVVAQGLQVTALSRFIALTPTGDTSPLVALAAHATDALDDMRAPLSESDRARRLASPLTERQIAYLDRYGYPFVHEEFRFHMTLTGPAPQDTIPSLRAVLSKSYDAAGVTHPVPIRSLAVFKQPRRNARFHVLAQVSLGPAAASE